MKTPTLSFSRKSLALVAWLLLVGVPMTAPAADPLCLSTTNAGLNNCRNTRRPKNWYTENIITNTTPVGSGAGMLDYRYNYMLCKNNQPCMRWVLQQGPPKQWVEDTACVYKITQDKVLEAESQCSLDNFDIRKRAEQCKAYVAGGVFSPFSGATLNTGTAGRVLPSRQPGNPNTGTYFGCANDLNMVTQTHADYPGGARSIDMGIGRWGTVTVSAYNGTSVALPKVNTSDKVREPASQLMRADGYSQNLLWTEQFSKAGDYTVWGTNQASALTHQLVAPYVQAGITPPITHTACYNNKASAFVQGFSNPAGGGATATAANIDVTTGNQAPPNPNGVQQLIADLRTVSAALSTFKSVRYCTEASNRWMQACGMISTYSHSMGAIVTRTFNLPTSLTIGSVDNVGGGASYRNNCDPIPWVTQQGIRYLLAAVPRPVGKNYALCTQPNQMNCLRGNRWISGPGGGPRTAECDTLNQNDPTYQDRCERWWCAGQPGSPSTQIYSGRDTLPTKISSTGNWAHCPNEASYQAGMQACFDQYLAGTTNSTGLLTCLQNIAQLAAGAMSGGSDHLLKGRAGATDYNGYEVISGLDNLGRPSSVGFRGAYLHNPPPKYPDKPVMCGDGVCEAGQETSTTCASDCYTPPPDAGPPASYCGNGVCAGSETYSNCPSDCPAPPPADAGPTNYCGNGVCAGSETYYSCPSDCPNPCGSGGCDGGM